MSSATKRRKIEEKGPVTESASIGKAASSVSVGCSEGIDLLVQQAKKFAVTQAQQEGCLGNYKSVDSPFGNYLVPVIPTRTDLYRYISNNLPDF
ncbi:hypothetical protein IHE45_17G033700 [Dioscorea alata]|uniref:Uncharacterized protein n=1 Tax=Dioscorea alata TaxID=55571 RepID=A0ACB7UBI9_DIOAL|nr:hypothetical protein IHE45_17G033700 [Dioscorea alata]